MMKYSANAIELLCWDVIYRDVRTRTFWLLCSSASAEILSAATAVQRQASADVHRWSVSSLSNVLLCRGLKTSVQKEWVMLQVIQI